jgi:hypothetical protein
VKTIAETLGVARSNLIERRDDAKAKRGPQDRPGDLELSADIRRLVDQRPTYGYRRIAALLKRERRSDGLAPINTKRVYRLMKKHGLLLERHTGRRRLREHDGQVATADSEEAGQAFRQEGGHRFRVEAGRDSDLMSATWHLLPRIDVIMFCPERLVKRAWIWLSAKARVAVSNGWRSALSIAP